MDGLSYNSDPRYKKPEANAHGKAFKNGWNDATMRDKEYGTAALEELTWQNLGYRLGKILGPTSEDTQEAMYNLCVRQQREANQVASEQ